MLGGNASGRQRTGFFFTVRALCCAAHICSLLSGREQSFFLLLEVLVAENSEKILTEDYSLPDRAPHLHWPSFWSQPAPRYWLMQESKVSDLFPQFDATLKGHDYVLNCAPLRSMCWSLNPQDLRIWLYLELVFKEVIKVKWDHYGGI